MMMLLLGNNASIIPFVSIFTFNTENMPISGALWFLTSLFFVDIIFYLISKIQNQILRYFIIIMVSLFGCIIPYFTRLPWALETACMGVGLYTIGVLFKKLEKKIGEGSTIYKSAILSVLIGSIITFINGYINVRQGSYSNIILYYIVATLMTYGLYIIAKGFLNYNGFVIEELKFIGKNSLVYVCLNQIVLLIPSKIVSLIDNRIILLGGKILTFLCSLIILHILVIVLNKKYIRWALGK